VFDVVDATIIDESAGATVCRHESRFRFDADRYREWTAGTLGLAGGGGPLPAAFRREWRYAGSVLQGGAQP